MRQCYNSVMENKSQADQNQLINSQPNAPVVTDANYVDPNSKQIQDTVKPVVYQPNKKLTVILLILFLVTAAAGLIISQRNAQKYRESVQPKQLLIPTKSPTSSNNN